ncbi:hypothetical protein G4B88_022125 [Cannabis sativa]|uniref:WAT1-related protein n=1 Tax=Cannabis sativa TaxID=3483 RepID=A0A7J6FGH7_CANSA|nr:hypothetical protein G4B88_022125 [Cannabis sativa]
MKKIWEGMHEVKPALLMMVAQIAYAGVNVLYKLAANDGMSLKVIVAYRFLFATVFIFPLAFFIERGSLVQNLYIQSLNVTSATYINSLPLSSKLLLEKLNLGSSSGKAKVLGTLVGIGGAMLLTLYKGVEINIWSTHVNFLNHGQHNLNHVVSTNEYGNRVLGCFFSVASSIHVYDHDHEAIINYKIDNTHFS